MKTKCYEKYISERQSYWKEIETCMDFGLTRKINDDHIDIMLAV